MIENNLFENGSYGLKKLNIVSCILTNENLLAIYTQS